MTCFCRAGVFPGTFVVVVCAFVALGFTPTPIVCVSRAGVYPGADCVRLSRWGLPRRRLCAFVSLGFTPASHHAIAVIFRLPLLSRSCHGSIQVLPALLQLGVLPRVAPVDPPPPRPSLPRFHLSRAQRSLVGSGVVADYFRGCHCL